LNGCFLFVFKACADVVQGLCMNGNIIPQNLPEAKKIFTALAKENVPQAKESLAMVDKMIADQAKAPAATAAVKK
jgi:uncharacterized protein